MKVRRIDFFQDEFLAGTAGMTNEQVGAYWRICALQYSRGRGVPDDPKILCPYLACTETDLLRLIEDLVGMRKLRRTRYGLVNARAELELGRARKRIARAVQNGKKGGRPPRSETKSQSENNSLPEPDRKLTTNHQPPTSTESPAEPLLFSLQDSQNPPDSSDPSVRTARGAPAGFDAFWQAYPHKVGKQTARKAFRNAGLVPLTALVSAVQDYIRTKPPDRQWCNPATWLNQERWLDQPARAGPVDYADLTTETLRRMEPTCPTPPHPTAPGLRPPSRSTNR